MAVTPNSDSTTRNTKSKLGLTLAPAANVYPISYVEDTWDVVTNDSADTAMKTLMGGTGQFDQHKINKALAENVGGDGTAEHVKYQHTNEINFKNVPQNLGNIWFNYRNGDTDAVDTSDVDVTYKFGNNNAKTSKTTLDAASFTGNAATATTLQTTRTINGTNFNGSADITTSSWGTSRNISISDSDSTNTGTATSVNGSSAVTLKLPSTIKASLSGNATTATTATKLGSSNVGNAINPIYLSAGTATACNLYRHHYDATSDYASYAWHKVAYAVSTSTNEDRLLTLLVSKGNNSSVCGILKCRLRINNSSFDTNNSDIYWIISSDSIDNSNFVMVWTSSNSTAELWCKISEQWGGYHFKVLDSGSRGSNGSLTWTLCDSVDGHGSASYTSGGTVKTSKYGDLLNNVINVKGAAGTANTSRHVWFSDNSTETKRNYSDYLLYNPSTQKLTVGMIDVKSKGSGSSYYITDGDILVNANGFIPQPGSSTVCYCVKANLEGSGTLPSNSNCAAIYGSANFGYAGLFSGAVKTTTTLVAGTSVTAPTVYQTSDDRLKDYVGDFHFSLDDIDKIPLRVFNYKDDESKRLHIGTSAQSVQKILPQIVGSGYIKENDDNEYLTVEYSKLSLVAIDCIKQLKAEINELKAEIKKLKGE